MWFGGMTHARKRSKLSPAWLAHEGQRLMFQGRHPYSIGLAQTVHELCFLALDGHAQLSKLLPELAHLGHTGGQAHVCSRYFLNLI